MNGINDGVRVEVPFWDRRDEHAHRVVAVESPSGETVQVELDGALGNKLSFEITATAALALVAALSRLQLLG